MTDVVTIVAVAAGAFFFLAGSVGLLRFPDLFSRLHALTKADNLGLGFVAIGVAFQADSMSAVFKIVLIWLMTIFSSAAISHLVARETFNRTNASHGEVDADLVH